MFSNPKNRITQSNWKAQRKVQQTIGTKTKKTPTKKQARQLRRFYSFFLGCWDVLHPGDVLETNWHVELLADCCQCVFEGKLKNIVINIQPRSLKSEIVSVAYPCWVWLHRPGAKFLCVSYASSLANGHNQDRRTLIKSAWYCSLLEVAGYGDFELREDKNRISEFGNNYRGEMISRGLDSGVTGVGAGNGGCLVFDDGNDPVKTESDRIRSETERKFRDYSVGRRNDPKKTPVINIQQRCHTDDLTGYISKELADKYSFMVIPTRAEEYTEVVSPLTGKLLAVRQQGDLMHPERFGEEQDAEALRTLGAYMYAARHQQQPYAKSGGIFAHDWLENFFVIEDVHKDAIAVVSVDATFGAVSDTASYVVIQLWLVKRPYFMLYDQCRDRLTFPETEKALKDCRNQWQKEIGKPISATLIEGKANGKAIIQTVRSQFPGIIEINPTESKKARAEAVAPTYQSGNVLLRRGASFIPIFQMEHERFPNYSSDDCVDGASQLINYYLNRWRIEDLSADSEAVTIRVKKY